VWKERDLSSQLTSKKQGSQRSGSLQQHQENMLPQQDASATKALAPRALE
jgi:hypothetical protein